MKKIIQVFKVESGNWGDTQFSDMKVSKKKSKVPPSASLVGTVNSDESMKDFMIEVEIFS